MASDATAAARARTAAAVLAAGLAVAACEPPAAQEVLLGPTARADFALASTNLRNGALPAGQDLVVRFTVPLDAASVGPRTLVVTTPRGRVSGTLARVDGAEVRFPADALRAQATGLACELRIEGGASPCALRAADGAELGARITLPFRVESSARADVLGPVLLATRPADGAADVAPGSAIELRFSEPVATGAADAVSLAQDGLPVAARGRLSPDRRRLLVRPVRPFAAGATVEVTVRDALADDAGNPLRADSPRSARFAVRTSTLHEIEEDFSCDEFVDRGGTGCAWGDLEAPGVLAARYGTMPLPCLDAAPTTELPDLEEIRFQVRVRGDEVVGGLGTGLRLRFARTDGAPPLRAARVEAGAADYDALDPWFAGNRAHARLGVVAETTAPLAGVPEGERGAVVDVPFDVPLALVPGVPLLLDVTLTTEPGARLAASPDADARALVAGGGREPLLPAAALLVCGADPVARSLWYDAGTPSPQWGSAAVALAEDVPGVRVVVRYQAAPADDRGAPDLTMASSWESDLAQLPAWRFVRFRVRFEGASWDGRAARVDRISMPFDVPAR